MFFNKEELYFDMEIDNGSSVDYELNFLNISVETRKRGKKKSVQNLVLEPLLLYQAPIKVARGERGSFVYVLPKFSIAAESGRDPSKGKKWGTGYQTKDQKENYK